MSPGVWVGLSVKADQQSSTRAEMSKIAVIEQNKIALESSMSKIGDVRIFPTNQDSKEE